MSNEERTVDLVIPMVFPSDSDWQADYARYHGSGAAAQRNVRFRSWGTEELLIRCCLRYMPWVRTIHVLLARESQRRLWMEKYPLHVVYHREFIPEQFLPCFSSPCIEMFLDRIPGLSERFVYANDDTFPLSPLKEDDFFRDGLPCQAMGEKPYPQQPNIFTSACLGGLNLVAAPFGRHYRRTWLKGGHGMAALTKEACREVWRRHGNDLLEHICPLKRRPDSYSQYLYGYYQHLSGRYVRHQPRTQYVGPKTPTELIAPVIRDPEAGVVCLNDNEWITDWKQRALLVQREIERKLLEP